MAVSVKDLINNKKLIEDKKDKQIEIKVPDSGTFLFKLPNLNDYEDAEAYSKNRDNAALAFNKYIIESCCLEPDLKNKELLEAYEVRTAMDLIDKLFLIGEIAMIAKTLVNKAGFDEQALKVVEKVKN